MEMWTDAFELDTHIPVPATVEGRDDALTAFTVVCIRTRPICSCCSHSLPFIHSFHSSLPVFPLSPLVKICLAFHLPSADLTPTMPRKIDHAVTGRNERALRREQRDPILQETREATQSMRAVFTLRALADKAKASINIVCRVLMLLGVWLHWYSTPLVAMLTFSAIFHLVVRSFNTALAGICKHDSTIVRISTLASYVPGIPVVCLEVTGFNEWVDVS